MARVSESIFSGSTIIIPMADVQHVEKQIHSCDLLNGKKKGDISGYIIITKHSRWDTEADFWANNIYLEAEEGRSFLKAWMYYRYKLEGGKDAFINPE